MSHCFHVLGCAITRSCWRTSVTGCCKKIDETPRNASLGQRHDHSQGPKRFGNSLDQRDSSNKSIDDKSEIVKPKYSNFQFQDAAVREIGVRVMTELVEPFRSINLDETEFACLKAIVFFDPTARGLHDIQKIKRLRDQVQVIFRRR